MTIPRIYLEKPPETDQVILEADAARRLLRVLRVTPGDHIILFGWGPEEAVARVTDKGSDFVIAKIEQIRERHLNSVTIHLFASLVKHQQMDRLVEAAGMVGVARFVPLISERTVVRIDPDRARRKVARWNEIARHASALACITPPMQVSSPLPLSEAVVNAPQPVLLLYESADIFLFDWLDTHTTVEEVSLIMGPEGGWTDSEVEYVTAIGGVPVLLGPWILRPSVAVAVAVATLHCASRRATTSREDFYAQGIGNS
ncbi:MAG: RsmE family RNA methyltransferase [bacterium JZ-2024 1]